MYILGISAYYHDSAAALMFNGKVIAAAQEERFTRIKHDESVPINAIMFCLQYAEIGIEDIECVTFYDKPFLKFERLIETYISNVPKGLISFIKAIPIWTKQKLFLKKIIKDELNKISKKGNFKVKILFTEHHLSHAAGAFFTSSFKEAAILVVDGVGEWATTTLAKGNNNSIEIIKELHYPDSIGLLYSAFTFYCGFKVNSGEYKLMGLSPYATNLLEVERLKNLIIENICTIFNDGSIKLNQSFFTYSTGLKMLDDRKWIKLFGFPNRKAESEIGEQYCNLAKAIQLVINDIMCKLATHIHSKTGLTNLCISGGVALNCVSNKSILDLNLFEEIYIQPAAGDAGGCIGAALATHFIYKNNSREVEKDTLQNNCLLGPSFSNESVIKFANKIDAAYTFIENKKDLFDTTAKLLAEGNIIGWFNGKMEFGPRALGSRSILADARNKNMQSKLNLKIKYRESFRPFAPTILEDKAQEYFEINKASKYMLFVYNVKNCLPQNNYNDATFISKYS